MSDPPGGLPVESSKSAAAAEERGDLVALARDELRSEAGGRGLDIVHAALERHVEHGRGARTAIVAIGRDGRESTQSYAELARESSRFAEVLADLGVVAGDRVAVLLPRLAAGYAVSLGILARGAILCPLFASFGPAPIEARLRLSGARVLVTTEALHRRRIRALREGLPELRHVLLVDAADGEGALGLPSRMARAEGRPRGRLHDAEAPAFLHYTSGTTGEPKGALHVHGSVVAHLATAREALTLEAGDRYWCTADPGWVTGTVYGLIAPLAVGATLICDEGDFDPGRWLDLMCHHEVTVWYTAPSALRMLMRFRAGEEDRRARPRPRLIASVGELLDPAAVEWGRRIFGTPVRDTWWQTETGAIVLANRPGTSLEPGCMGLPVSGLEVGLLSEADAEGRRVPLDARGAVGELAIRAPWPSMFRGYWGEEERYRACFHDGWYGSGDLARREPSGAFRFVGRADDVIESAGHRIGPAEIEAVLEGHPSVVEAGVVGKPDPVIGHSLCAFVTVATGVPPDAELEATLRAHCRRELGPALAPREIHFVEGLPHTRSGKILRRVLREEAVGRAAPGEDA